MNFRHLSNQNAIKFRHNEEKLEQKVAAMIKEIVCDILIFGGHGDLALRKLMPALYHLTRDGYVSSESRIISVSRDEFTQEQNIALIEEKLKLHLKDGCFDAAFFAKFK